MRKLIGLVWVFVLLITLPVVYLTVINRLADDMRESRVERITSEPGYEAPGIMKVGEKWEADYIQHNKDNEYQVGITVEGKLRWYTLGEKFEGHELIVIVDKGLEKPYVIRVKDKKMTAVYELHIPEGEEIQAGVYEEVYMTQGSRSYYHDVRTTMIYPK